MEAHVGASQEAHTPPDPEFQADSRTNTAANTRPEAPSPRHSERRKLREPKEGKTKRSVAHRVGTWIGWIAAVLGTILCGASIWVLDTFGQISFQQMIANIPGLGGEGGGANPAFIKSFIVNAVVIPLAIGNFLN